MTPRTYSPVTRQAARLLGSRIELGRKERHWTVRQLAERVGVTAGTMRKIERGELSVSLGSAFEAAAIVGVALFDEDPGRLDLEASRLADRLAVLPKSIHPPRDVDDDF